MLDAIGKCDHDQSGGVRIKEVDNIQNNLERTNLAKHTNKMICK